MKWMTMPDYTYENLHRVCYGDEEDGDLICISVCPICRRYVKADKECYIYDYSKPNATCKKCGRVRMPDEGFI